MMQTITETIPATNDPRNIVLWVILAVAAAVLIGVTGILSAKKRRSDDDVEDDD